MPLKAAPAAQAKLLDLQALDTRLAQLNHQARTLPEIAALALLTTEADALRAALAERTGAWEDTGLELRRVESDVAVVEERIKRDKQRLQSSSSVKDVAALEQELAALAKRLGDLEEIELAVMERAEVQEKELASERAALEKIGAQQAEIRATKDASLAAIEAERARVAGDRDTIAAQIPSEVVDLYEKQRARYGTGASHLRGGVSSASGVRLNESDMQVVRAAAPDDVLICPDSQAVLVRTDESGL